VLAGVRGAVLEGQSHQDCPFEKIVEAVNPQRRLDGNPLYNVALLLQNFPPNLFHTQTLQASSIPVSLEAALLDLRFEIEPAQDGLSFTCEYKTDLFEQGTIDELLASWLKVFKTLVASPDTRVADFELSSGLKRPRP
jgi:non-ribosomal peptide synthetase component F